MNYTKPEAVVAGLAIAAVQGQSGKQFSGNPDGAMTQPKYTVTAYEADE